MEQVLPHGRCMLPSTGAPALQILRSALSAIDIAAMADLDHVQEGRRIVDRVRHSEVAYANAIAVTEFIAKPV